jgi:hypothetical protein
MKLLNSVPASNGSLTHYLPSGQYGVIAIEMVLDAAAGVTLTRANMGNIILNWNGQDVVNIDAEILNLLNNVYGGVSEFSAVAGGAHRFTAYIPCGQWFDSQNIYDVGDNDKVSVKLDFPDLALAANVDSGQINIYAKNRVGVMNYLHNIISRNIPASGASTLADSYPLNNVSQMYLKNPAALLTNVQIVKDGLTLVDAPPATLIAYSDFSHLLETTNTTLALDFIESKDIRESLGSTINYKYTFSGAGTLEQYFSFIEFTPTKAIESRDVARNLIGRKRLETVGFTPQPPTSNKVKKQNIAQF